MKKLLGVILVLVVLLIVALIAVSMLVPVDTYKTRILALVQEKTGRQVTIDGPVSLSLWPNIGLKAANISVSNPGWAGGENMLHIDSLRIGLALLPLLHKQVVLKELTIEKPVVVLVQNGEQKNWELEKTGAAPAAAATPAAASSAPGYEVTLGKIVITRGQILFKDLAQGKRVELEDVNLKLDAENLKDALTLEGSASFQGQKHEVRVQLGSLDALLRGSQTALAATWKSDIASAGFDGTFSNEKGLMLAGAVTAEAKGLHALLKQASPVPDQVAVKGQLQLSQAGSLTNVALSQTELTLDGTTLKGVVNARIGGAVPEIAASLSGDSYTVAAPQKAPAAPSGGAPAKGAAGDAGWSDAPIDLSGLRAVNANIALALNELHYQQAVVKPVNVTLQLQNGALVAQLKPAGIYDGTVSLTAKASAGGAFALDLALANVQAQPLLKDWAGYEKVDANMNATAHLTASGNSQKQIVSHLNGSGDMALKNGVYHGKNIAKMIGNVSKALGVAQADNSDDTRFTDCTATYAIANGVLGNHDLMMHSPMLRMSGEGTVDLPAQQVSYLLKPALVADLQGQGAKDATGGIMVPIRITGPMQHPDWKPDLAGAVNNVLQNPQAMKDTLKSARGALKNLKGAKGGNLLKGLLGGGGAATPAP